MAADPAERQRRIAAPVEEEQRLFALLQRRIDAAQHEGREEPAPRRRMLAHVHETQIRHGRIAETGRQVDRLIATLHRIDLAFDGGCRRDENGRKIPDPRANDGHVAGIIEDAILLLVGRIMLFIDNDQAKLGKGQEERRARAGNHTHLARHHLPPDLFACARREIGMPLGGLGTETILKPLQKARRQCDFRQQDQHLLAALQRLGHRLEIDLGLTGTRHAIDQRHRKLALVDGLDQNPRRILLHALQPVGDVIRIGRCNNGRRRQEDGLEHALSNHPVHDARRNACRMDQPQPRPRKTIRGQFDHPRPRRRHPLQLAFDEPQALDHRLRIESRGRAQRHARDIARRRQRIGRHPVEKGAHVVCQRRAIEDMIDGAQLLRIDRAALAPLVPDNANDLARPERHHDDGARHDMDIFRDRIGIRPRCRHGHEHRYRPRRLARRFRQIEQCGRIRLHRADHASSFAQRKPESATRRETACRDSRVPPLPCRLIRDRRKRQCRGAACRARSGVYC